MLNSIITFVILFLVWIVLSGFFSPYFLMLGIISCSLTVLINYLLNKEKQQITNLHIILIKTPLYFIWLIKEIVVSSFSITFKMWQIKPEVTPDYAWIQCNIRDELSMTILGNSITLTPGTVTMGERTDGMLLVHAIESKSLEDIKNGEMAQKVLLLTQNGGGK